MKASRAPPTSTTVKRTVAKTAASAWTESTPLRARAHLRGPELHAQRTLMSAKPTTTTLDLVTRRKPFGAKTRTEVTNASAKLDSWEVFATGRTSASPIPVKTMAHAK